MRTHPVFLVFFALALIGAAASVSAGDRAFVRSAMKSGAAEVQRAAVQANAVDYRVRQYAGEMNTDHQKANQQLAAIAADIGVDTGSTQPMQPQPATTPGLGRPNVPKGNPAALQPSAYFSLEVDAHRQAIALFSREASAGSNSKLRSYAQQTLPVLKQHLRLAQTYLKQERQLHH
jgi:putative membrane protein